MYFNNYEISPDGFPVKKSKRDFPYNYDTFVLYGTSNMEFGCTEWSDHILRRDYKKYNKCLMEVFGNEGQIWSSRDFKSIEKFLKLYLEDESIELVRVLEGCNQSSGYPVWAFQFNNDESKARKAQ